MEGLLLSFADRADSLLKPQTPLESSLPYSNSGQMPVKGKGRSAEVIANLAS